VLRLASLVVLGSLGACNAAFGVDELQYVSPVAQGGDGSGAGGTPGSGGAPSGVGGMGGAGGIGGIGGAGGATSPLASRGLLVRYFLDEDQDVAAVEATSPIPFALPIVPSANLALANIAGHGGMQWAMVGGDGYAGAVLASSTAGADVLAALSGANMVTLEFVADVQQTNGAFGRFVHAGAPSTSGRLSVSTMQNTDALILSFNDVASVNWDAELIANGRAVYQLVIDSTQATAADRARLYVNGAFVPPATVGSNSTLVLDASVSFIENNDALVLGNRSGGDRSLGGTLYYAAIYKGVLTDSELLQNRDILLASDDAP
jgi:hypothetical protein